MKRFLKRLTATALLTLLALPAAGAGAPVLVWSDEFNGPDGAAPDPARWGYDVGGNGWGNRQLEYDTNRRENVRQEGGNLVIEARKERYTGADNVTRDYTSARITTTGKFTMRYGRIEARIQIPEGQGMWPAFWLLGDDIKTAPWPNCGEMDVMENVGFEPEAVHGTVHGPGYSGGNGIGKAFLNPDGTRLSRGFHRYTLDWTPDSVQFSMDDHPYHTVTRASLPRGSRWVFDHPFFVILNVAVGGNWPKSPDSTTEFPQRMLVDYVRAWRSSP